ncbi:MAG TPA: 50S ribosomal protein L25 [bacterium]|jgi:large subunit ribosomal protein L25|nr:50S ribosomal protein L25 [bacterium]
MAEYKFTATLRSTKGKGSSKGLRSKDRLPAIVYGPGRKAYSVEVSAKEIPLLYLRTLGKNSLLTMSVTDEKGAVADSTVMFKEVQREPVKNRFLHVDFYHVDPAHPINLRVPVVLDGSAIGVREKGGILSHPTRSLRVRCLPADIPSEIKVDISKMDIDQSLLLKDYTPPKGVTFLGDPHTVLARVSMVEEEKVQEATAAAAAEGPEVITAKKPAEGEAAPAAGAKPAAGGDKKEAAKPAAKAPAKK